MFICISSYYTKLGLNVYNSSTDLNLDKKKWSIAMFPGSGNCLVIPIPKKACSNDTRDFRGPHIGSSANKWRELCVN